MFEFNYHNHESMALIRGISVVTVRWQSSCLGAHPHMNINTQRPLRSGIRFDGYF